MCLIVAVHAILTAKFSRSDTLYFTYFDLIMQLHVFMIVFIGKINMILPVTGKTPAHGQIFNLPYYMHGVYLSMAFGTIQFTGIGMNGMIEFGVIR